MTGTEKFAQRLKRLRVAAGLNIPQLAKLAGVSDSAIRQLESGESKSASFATGLHLSQILGVDPFVLAFGTGATLTARVLELERRLAAMEQERAEERRAAALTVAGKRRT
jgi:transcriptional regulator with XRE-family HTH domain